ncbi:MAG: type II secretion system F family protein [Planctomyces sp.]|nr:type II secretion system F family protein [Planctomyces sp.]
MSGSYLQNLLFFWNRPEPIRQTSLLMILAAGVGNEHALIDSLAAHAMESGSPWGDRVQSLRLLIEQGMPLSTALANNHGLLPESTVAAIRVAEQTGVLREVLADEAIRLAGRDQYQGSPVGASLVNSLIWMFSVGVAASLLVGFIMVWIIPKEKRIFEDFNQQLPSLTILLIDFSDWFMNYWYLVLFFGMTVVGIGSLILFYGQFQYVSRGRLLFSEQFPRYWLPLLLRMFSAATIGNRDLNATVHALQSELRPGRASRAFSNLRAQLSVGVSLIDGLISSRLINVREANFLRAAETSSHLDWGLLHLSHSLEQRRLRFHYWFSQLFHVATTLTMGFLVMFVVVALFLPLIKLISDLTEQGGSV